MTTARWLGHLIEITVAWALRARRLWAVASQISASRYALGARRSARRGAPALPAWLCAGGHSGWLTVAAIAALRYALRADCVLLTQVTRWSGTPL